MPIPNCENGHYFNADEYEKCPICNGRKATEGFEETARAELEVPPEEWVCGWIVCQRGVNYGRSYIIKPGKNFVGKKAKNDIIILGDKKIADRDHTCIIYDQKSRSTVLTPGSSNGIVYHMDKAVYEPVVMKIRDRIGLGDSEFVFIPFCDGSFDWQDIKNEWDDMVKEHSREEN